MFTMAEETKQMSRVSRCLKALLPGGKGGRIQNCEKGEELYDNAQWHLDEGATTVCREVPSQNQSVTHSLSGSDNERFFVC